MNSTQMLNIVRTDPCLRRYVRGVFASNTLPATVTQFPSAFIVNTQPLPLPGEHWVAFIVFDSFHGEFFDSLGKSPADYNPDIQNFFNKNKMHCTFKTIPLQPYYSDWCGLYVLVYLIARLCFKYSLNRVYALFPNIHVNDTFVKHFMHDYVRY